MKIGTYTSLVCLLLLGVTILGVSAHNRNRGSSYYPLPLFTSVEVEANRHSEVTMIKVTYRAPRRPLARWFVDGFPIPEGRVDFNLVDIHGITILTIKRDKGRQFSLCLKNTVGETCMEFAPLPHDGYLRQTVAFPWPLLVPAPLARYNRGEQLRIFAPELNTPNNYSYAVNLISKNPIQPNGPIVLATSHGMEGGFLGDAVTLTRVTTGRSQGWMVEVDTMMQNYEGVLMFVTHFTTNQSQLVRSCNTTRPITIYRRDHKYPFGPNFIATIPSSLPWSCRAGFDCLVICPFVSNGPVNVTLSRLVNNGAVAQELLSMNPGAGEETERIVGRVRMLGSYYGEGEFIVPNYSMLFHSGSYTCRVESPGGFALRLITLK